MNADYADEPTKIRVFDDPGWAIDGVDDDGAYTEAVWTHYDGVELTRETAIAHAAEFARASGISLCGAPFVISDPSS